MNTAAWSRICLKNNRYIFLGFILIIISLCCLISINFQLSRIETENEEMFNQIIKEEKLLEQITIQKENLVKEKEFLTFEISNLNLIEEISMLLIKLSKISEKTKVKILELYSEKEISDNFIQKTKIHIHAEGSFSQLVSFLNSVKRLNLAVTIDSCSISPQKEKNDNLVSFYAQLEICQKISIM